MVSGVYIPLSHNMTTHYTVGARVPGCTADPTLHITLAYLGELTAEEIAVHRTLIAELLAKQDGWPEEGLAFGQGSEDMFGPLNDMPVWRVHMLGSKNANGMRSADLWLDYFRAWSKTPPGMPQRLDSPNYHITIKKPEVAQWVREQEALHPLKAFLCTQVFLKRLGPHDPEFVFSAAVYK